MSALRRADLARSTHMGLYIAAHLLQLAAHAACADVVHAHTRSAVCSPRCDPRAVWRQCSACGDLARPRGARAAAAAVRCKAPHCMQHAQIPQLHFAIARRCQHQVVSCRRMRNEGRGLQQLQVGHRPAVCVVTRRYCAAALQIKHVQRAV